MKKYFFAIVFILATAFTASAQTATPVAPPSGSVTPIASTNLTALQQAAALKAQYQTLLQNANADYNKALQAVKTENNLTGNWTYHPEFPTPVLIKFGN